MDPILQWILTTIGGGSLGAAITYIFTFKSRQKIAKAEAETAQVKADHERLDLKQDQYDYLQNMCDKYMRDYHELEAQFRKRGQELSESISKLTQENAKIISDKCTEIAALKSQVTYLKGIRCYNFTCTHRVKTNPDKSE